MIRISVKKLLGAVFVVLILAAVIYVALFLFSRTRTTPLLGIVSKKPSEADRVETSLSNAPQAIVGKMPFDIGFSQPDISDTREFLKVNYSANISTRDVSRVVRQVKGAVREVEGRVDSENSSEKRGRVSFVVPKSKFEKFRDEIESITHKKLYTETVSSQNLLSQKQDLEQQMESAESILSRLEQQKKDLDAQHKKTIDTINRDLGSVQSRLSAVRKEVASIQDEARLSVLRSEEGTLVTRQQALLANRNRENNSYDADSANLTNQINQANQNIEQVGKQDEVFAGNIETVSGYVTVEWVSLWKLAVIFSPVHPAIVIAALVLVGWYVLTKKGYLPGVEFV